MMSEPITEAMAEAGAAALAMLPNPDPSTEIRKTNARLIYQTMVAARAAEKVELSREAKDLVLRLAMGEQPLMTDDLHEINQLREHRLIEAGSEQPMVRWGIKGDLTPLPPGIVQPSRRMFFRLTDKGAAYIAKETSNDDR